MVLKHPTKNAGMHLSILDLVMVNAVDGSPNQSMQNSLDCARHAERWRDTIQANKFTNPIKVS